MSEEPFENADVIETYIPDDKSINEFHGMSLDKKLRIIKLGLFFLKEGNLKNQAWDNEQWQDRINNLNMKHQTLIQQYTHEISELKTNMQRHQQDALVRQQECVAGAVAGERNKYELQIKSLTETNHELLGKMNNLASEIEKRYASRMMEMNRQHQEILMQANEKREEMRKNYESQLARQQNSSLKGKDGEGYVFGKLNMLFPTADVEDTHSIPHRGDFIIRDDGMTMMIETKNYSRNVQKAEIDKFYSDISNSANGDIQCALFVSLNTGICNKDDFQFEICNGTPVIFIHNLNSNFDSIPLATRFFRMVLDAKEVDFSNKEIIDAFKNAASSIKRIFSKQKTTLDRYYNQQMEMISLQYNNIEQLFGIIKQKF